MKVTYPDYSTRQFTCEEFWAIFNRPYLQVVAESPCEERYARAAMQAKLDAADATLDLDNVGEWNADYTRYIRYPKPAVFAWRWREAQREVGILCERLIELLGDRYQQDTFLHRSETHPEQVAYTKCLLDGLANKQTRCTPGRYLKAVYDLPDHEIGDMLRTIEAPSRPLHVWTTREQMNKCFETKLYAEGEGSRSGGYSCMYGKFDGWTERPYHIYADHPELCVIVQLDGAEVAARSVAFRDTKNYVRVYARDENFAARMHEDLRLEGWTRFTGSRDVRVAELRHGGRLLCAYIDFSGDVRTTSGIELCTESTDGYGDEGERCHNCGNSCEEESREHDGNTWCQQCFDDSFSWYCERCDEYQDADDFSNVDDEYVCRSCAQNANTCDRCDSSTFESLNDVGSESWCQGCTDEHAAMCENCDETVPTNDTENIAGDTWCKDCVSSHTVTCADCGEVLPREDAKEQESSGNVFCHECFDTAEQLVLALES